MNQILSVDNPKNSKKRLGREGNKASIKSVTIFFCIILIIFGISVTALGFYSLNNKQEVSIVDDATKNIRIDVIQNATELEIEVTSKNELAKVEYRWDEGELQEVSGDGKNVMSINVRIPGGTKTLNITATDVNGETREYSNQYVGPKEPKNIQLAESENENKILVKCEEEQNLSYISYFYDEEEEKKIEVSGTSAQTEIDVKEGEHVLTVRVGYADGTVAQIFKKLYVPTIEVGLTQDLQRFTIKITDPRNITKLTANFNGQEVTIDVNKDLFENTLPLQNGENRLILTVYNTDGGKIIKKIRYVKK